MVRSGVRVLGSVCLLVALLAGTIFAYLGLRKGDGLSFTSLAPIWSSLTGPASDQSVMPGLGLPAFLVLGTLGLALLIAGRLRGRLGRSPSEAGSDADGAGIPGSAPATRRSELWTALARARGAFLWTTAFSLIINVLMLTGAIFMLEIYDRVLPSRSIPTLIGLCLIAGVLFAALGLLDMIRSRVLVRASGAIEESLAARVFDVVVRLPIRAGNRGDGLQPIRDLDAIRSFLSGPGPTALFDLPWLPFYLWIVYLFHPWLGMTALLGAVVLVCLTLLTELLARRPMREATLHSANRGMLAEASRRNAEVLAGMGFASRLGRLWRDSYDRVHASQRRASDITGGLGAIARMLRLVLQSAMLAVGAYLVILEEASPGIIIAGSILAARALAPVDTAIVHWRGLVAARLSWQHLNTLLAQLPPQQLPTVLPLPSQTFEVENITVVPPGERKVVVRDVSFKLKCGQGLGIIGPSGSGKSSLARVLVGAWLPATGRVRLDGATLGQWAPEALGQHIGYLPQDVELFAGSILQNIARFDPKADTRAVIEAAKAADVDDLIRSLPGDRGYDTEIGEGGMVLSAGQRQRVALARALYGEPFLVVLDEPDASLDRNGELALHDAIRRVRERQGIVIVISHRQTVLGALDHLLVLEQGRPVLGGPKELVLQRLDAGGVHFLKSAHDARSDKT